MSDDIRQLSLFSPTSAFVPPEIPSPEELADRMAPPLSVGQAVPEHSQRLARLEELIEDAMAATTNTDLLDCLEQALEVARGA